MAEYPALRTHVHFCTTCGGVADWACPCVDDADRPRACAECGPGSRGLPSAFPATLSAYRAELPSHQWATLQLDRHRQLVLAFDDAITQACFWTYTYESPEATPLRLTLTYAHALLTPGRVWASLALVPQSMPEQQIVTCCGISELSRTRAHLDMILPAPAFPAPTPCWIVLQRLAQHQQDTARGTWYVYGVTTPRPAI